MSNAVLDATRAKRAKAQKKLDEFLAGPKAENRSLTDVEDAEFEKLAARVEKLDRQIKALDKEERRAEKATEAAAGETRESVAVVTREQMTYDRDGRNSYFRDLAALMVPQSNLGSPAAANERLMQHAKELEIEARRDEQLAARLREIRMTPAGLEQRVAPNTTAGTGGEFVPPLWLVSQYVPFVRPTRVIANRVRNLPLPPGIDIINLPKIKTGSLTAIQPAQGGAVASQDIATSTVSAAVNTLAGQEDISLQLLEQSPLAMDNVIFDDLSRDYDQRLDIQVLVGSGTNGQHQGTLTQSAASAGINTDITKINAATCGSTVFADASTTGTQFRSIGSAKTSLETLRFAAATAIWVHPRRSNNWEVAAFDTTGRPLFVPYAPFNAFGVDQPNVPQGVAGTLAGLPVVKDANMPITCATGAVTGGTGDCIAVVKEDDLYLWEGTMRMRALPEILSGTLQIRFQVYAYSAYMPNRFPPSTSLITGTTGLAAPTF